LSKNRALYRVANYSFRSLNESNTTHERASSIIMGQRIPIFTESVSTSLNFNLSVSFVSSISAHIFALKTQRYAPHSYQRPALFAPSQHHDCSQRGAPCHRQNSAIYRCRREMLEQREQNIKLVLSVMPSRDSIALYEMAHRQFLPKGNL